MLRSPGSRFFRDHAIVIVAVLLSAEMVASGATTQPAAWPAAGTVFVDANGDGKLSEGEKGLSGVVISDGVQVLKAGADGKFAFDAVIDPILRQGERPIVTMSTPDGHANTTNWFFRIDGKKEHDTAILFGVKPQEQKRPFDFVHITDLHWVGGKLYDDFRQDMKDGGDSLKFIINTGDMWTANHFDPKIAWEREGKCKAVMEGLPMPWRATAGNHDLIDAHALTCGWKKTDHGYGYQLYWEMYGPLRWSFNYAGVHFIGVDMMERDADDNASYGATKEALGWLAKDLATTPKDMPVYLLGHCFADKWLPLLEKANFRGVFYGDGHEDRTDRYHGKIPFVETGSMDPTGHRDNRGYRVVRIEKDGNFFEVFKYPGEPIGIHFLRRDLKVTPEPKPVLSFTGYVYGMEVTDKNLSVKLDDVPAEVTVGKPHPMKSPFTVKADLLRVPAGYNDVVITVSNGDKKVSEGMLFLNRYGPNDPVKGIGKVTLGICLAGVDVPAEIRVNDTKVATVDKTSVQGVPATFDTRTQKFTFDLPDGLVKRMNQVEVKPGLHDGKPDVICIGFLWMEAGGTAYRDMYLRGYGASHGTPFKQCVDLKTPMPEPNRKHFFSLMDKHVNQK